jgi:outer membrane murein-binding lipoprotein Lpp
MRMINRLCLLSLFAGAFALMGCSSTAEVAKAKADAEATKAELAQVKSELAQLKSELAKVQGPQDAGRVPGGRFQLILDQKGGAYLFDPETGKVLHSGLKGGGWMMAADPAR